MDIQSSLSEDLQVSVRAWPNWQSRFVRFSLLIGTHSRRAELFYCRHSLGFRIPRSRNTALELGSSSFTKFTNADIREQQGLKVYIASSSATRVADAIDRIKSSLQPGSPYIKGHTIDLSSDDVEVRLENLLTDITTELHGPLDHIVFTANRLNLVPISALAIEYLRTVPQVNFHAPLLLAKLVRANPAFLNPSYRSSFTLTTGAVADRPVRGYEFGSGIAAALVGITRGLALDMKPIRVNVVSPGATDTEMWGEGEMREMRRKGATERAFLGKVVTAEEVGEAYLYLMKDSNCTGTCINTNGGAFLQ